MRRHVPASSYQEAPETVMVLDPATGNLDEDAPDRFASSLGPLRWDEQKRNIYAGATAIAGACPEVVAVHEEPFRMVARCEDDDTLVVFDAEGTYRELQQAPTGKVAAGPAFATTQRVDRVWCPDETETCFDLVRMVPIEDALEWAGEAFGLAFRDWVLYALDFEHDGRWIVDGLTEGELPSGRWEDLPNAGEVIALWGDVVDAREHRVVSRGPWEVHAVRADGAAMVTTTTADGWSTGPVRLVPRGTFEQ